MMKHENDIKCMPILTPPKSYRLVLLSATANAICFWTLYFNKSDSVEIVQADDSGPVFRYSPWRKSCDKNLKLKVARNETCKYSQTKKKTRYRTHKPTPAPTLMLVSF